MSSMTRRISAKTKTKKTKAFIRTKTKKAKASTLHKTRFVKYHQIIYKDKHGNRQVRYYDNHKKRFAKIKPAKRYLHTKVRQEKIKDIPTKKVKLKKVVMPEIKPDVPVRLKKRVRGVPSEDLETSLVLHFKVEGYKGDVGNNFSLKHRHNVFGYIPKNRIEEYIRNNADAILHDFQGYAQHGRNVFGKADIRLMRVDVYDRLRK